MSFRLSSPSLLDSPRHPRAPLRVKSCLQFVNPHFALLHVRRCVSLTRHQNILTISEKNYQSSIEDSSSRREHAFVLRYKVNATPPNPSLDFLVKFFARAKVPTFAAIMWFWLFGSEQRAPVLLKYRSSKSFIIIVVSTSIFIDIFTYGIVVPVLPFALTTRSNIPADSTQTWVSIFLAVYGAGLLAAAPICGFLADRSPSRQAPLLLGLLALGGATVLLCLGNSIGMLAAGRALQGISAAVVWVVGLALLADTVGPDEIGQAMGYVGLSMSLAILLSPLLGGIVFAKANYYSVFSMAFGLIILDIFMRLFMIEKKRAIKWLPREVVYGEQQANENKTEPKAQKDVEADTPSPVTSLSEGRDETAQKLRSDAPGAQQSAAESVPPATAPVPAKKVARKLPPVVFLFASRRVLNVLWASTIQSTLICAFDSILPLFVRDTFHWDSLGAGLIFLPLVIVTFAGPAFGWVSDKYGPRWLAVAGFVMAAPFLILLRLVNHDSMGQKVLLCALLALIGVALTMMLVPLMAEITYAVDAKAKRHPPGFFGKHGAYAQAYSLFNMAWAAGSLIGPLLGGLIKQHAGWPTTTLVLGIVSLVTAIPAAIWTGGSIFKKRRNEQAISDET